MDHPIDAATGRGRKMVVGRYVSDASHRGIFIGELYFVGWSWSRRHG